MSQKPSMALAVLAAASCLLDPASLAAQDAASILRTLEEKQAERWKDVDDYTITKAIEVAGGAQAPMYFEKFTAEDGTSHFRFVTPGEYTRQVMEDAGFPPPTPGQIEQMAMGYEMLGAALEQGGGDMPPMPGAGLMMGAGAEFLRAGAKAQREENDGRADAHEAAEHMEMFAQRAQLRGRETLDQEAVVRGLEDQLYGADSVISSWIPDRALQTREAFVLVAKGLADIALEQPEDGGTYKMREATLWIDSEDYVPLRLEMLLDVENGGKTTPMTLEKFNLDYRQVGPLLEPFVEVFRISGLMAGLSDKDRKEMEQARKDLAEAKKQLEAMPASQRAMVERMMKGQIEKAEKMLAGDAMLTTIRTVSVAVNEGPPTPFGPGELTVGGPTGAAYAKALTMAAEERGDGGLVAELAVSAQQTMPEAQASITLYGAGPFPDEGAQVAIARASGNVSYDGKGIVTIEGGSGTISVTERTDTRIAGTFSGGLTGMHHTGDGEPVAVSITLSGTFDSGAPAGPYQPPRGSPFDLFEMGPPPGSPAAEGSTP